MSDSHNSSMDAEAGLSATVTGEVAVAAVFVIFMLFVVSLVLYLRTKRYTGTMGSSRSRRLVFAPNQPSAALRHALDPCILKSLSVTVFRSEEFKEDRGLECAVCLSELTDGEKVRLLPKCRHGFHVECIDMWFISNSTCPVCREPVGTDSSVEDPVQTLGMVSETGHSEESQISFRNTDEGSSSSMGTISEKRKIGRLVIDIPQRVVEGFTPSNSPLPPSRVVVEGIKSPALERLRSLRRILSRGGNKGVGGSSCPIGGDIEQGLAPGIAVEKSLPVPKSPRSL